MVPITVIGAKYDLFAAETEPVKKKPPLDHFRAAFLLRKPLQANRFSRLDTSIVSVESGVEHR